MSTLSEMIASTKTDEQISALPGVRAHHCAVALPRRIVVGCQWSWLVIGLSFVRRQGGLLPGFDDHELAHHALVLVPQQVAVVHVRRRRIGVVLEPHDQRDTSVVGPSADRVLPSRQLAAGGGAPSMRSTRNCTSCTWKLCGSWIRRCGPSRSRWCRPSTTCVDAAHVHLRPLMLWPVEREAAVGDGLRGVGGRQGRERCRHLGRGVQRCRRRAVRARRTRRRRRGVRAISAIAAPSDSQHDAAPRASTVTTISARSPGDSGMPVEVDRRLEQAAVGRDQIERRGRRRTRSRRSARRRGVEQAQPHALGRHVEVGAAACRSRAARRRARRRTLPWPPASAPSAEKPASCTMTGMSSTP